MEISCSGDQVRKDRHNKTAATGGDMLLFAIMVRERQKFFQNVLIGPSMNMKSWKEHKDTIWASLQDLHGYSCQTFMAK